MSTPSKKLVPVYDILNCGPRHRFAANGKIVHNSHKLNQQNMPRIGKKPQLTDSLRKSLRAPKGHKIVVADLSGIELRVMHFLWQVGYSTEMYRADPAETDLYVDFASKFYKKPVDEVTKEERQVGKVCLAEGTLVLTDQGEIPIEQVTASHRVWDGVEWVPTDGAIYNGEREVITYDGITATPDHEVWVEDGRKVQIGYAAAQSLRLARGRTCWAYVGAIQAGGHRDHTQEEPPICSRGMYRMRESIRGFLRQFASMQDNIMQRMREALRCPELAYQPHACGQGTMQQPKQSLVLQLRRTWDRVSVCIQRSRGGVGDGESWTAQGYGTGSHRQQWALRAWKPALGQPQAECGQQAERHLQEIPHIQSSAPGDSLCRQYAEKSTTSGSDRRADSGAMAQTIKQTKRRVWDLLNCGPRHRFTANGRLVSNCHLQLQYGSGAAKFTFMAKTMGGVTLEQDESQRVVDAYRGLHPEITHGWRVMTGALTAILHGTVGMELDPCGLCHTIEGGIESPRGRLYYPNLKCERNPETGYMEWTYDDRNPRTRKVEPVKIYGAKLGQNLVQYLAREVMCDMMLEIQKIAPIIHTVHDEVILAVPESEAEDTLAEVQRIMRSGVSWFPDLVTWSDGDIADTYGDAKS